MKYIDLFAGAGGLSEGFIRAGFEPVAHIESDRAACYTLKTRTAYHYLKNAGQEDIYHKYLKKEISRTELYSHVPPEKLNSVINEEIGAENVHSLIERIKELNGGTDKVDLIVGGPPCQAYSVIGRARHQNGMKGDPRNFLYKFYAEFLRAFQPEMFVFENVKGLRSAGGGKFLENIENIVDKSDYHMECREQNSINYGVLQNRERLIIIGWKKTSNHRYPIFNPIHHDFKVKDALTDLPKIKAGEKYTGDYEAPTNDYLNKFSIRNGLPFVTQHEARNHTDQDLEIYRRAIRLWKDKQQRLNYADLPKHLRTHKNTTSFTDRFKVVAPELTYSHTVVAHISKDGHYYIHPDEEQCRSLSIREAARLQSFPDDYYFEGVKEGINRTPAFRQIGNAVPPLMAEVIARTLRKRLARV
ncbi:DNA cytosine methyltransferase [Roseivirga sp. BDSF3-8]|uniref:DNA cytosine methyltransferase n=1 Tax=Roseivirga sp. BDSF3-8 TaxID=3241598 RepID=UPI003531D1BA